MMVLGPIRSSSRPPVNAPAAATTLAATPKMTTWEALSPYTETASTAPKLKTAASPSR